MKAAPANNKPNQKLTQNESNKNSPSIFRLCFLLALVSFVVYANTFNNGYAYDDISIIKNNTIVTKGISAIPEILSTPYRWGFYKTSNDLYRPLSQVMFAVEYQLFDGSPSPGHVINVLLFCGCVVLLFLFLDAFFDHKRTVMAFIAAILFALHPIHTEVVANIKGRDELLCFFFAFLSLYVFMWYQQQGKIKHFITATLCFFLALLSKETAITMLGIIPLLFFFYKNDNKQRSLLITANSAVAAFVFLAIRTIVLNMHHAGDVSATIFIDNQLAHAPFETKLATGFLVCGMYLKMLFVPYPLICDYGYNTIPSVHLTNGWALLSLAIYLLLLGVGIFRLVRFRKDAYAFGILFFLITISLFTNIIILTGTLMGERLLFFASAGFCLLAALGIELLVLRLTQGTPITFTQKKLLYIVVPIALVFAAITFNRNSDWTDNLTLFSADVKKAPNNARLNYYLGNELLATVNNGDGDVQTKTQYVNDAINYLQKSVAIYPDYNDAHRVLGNACFFARQYDSAEYHFKRALALKGDDMDAWSNLDVLYYNTQKFRQSIEVCKTMIKLDTAFADKYNNIGICYIKLAEYDSAEYYLKKGITTREGFLPFYQSIALAYKMDNKKDSALKYQSIVQQTDPHFTVY